MRQPSLHTAGEFQPTRGIADLVGAHAGEDGAIVGTGISLEGFSFDDLAGLVTIGLNESVKLMVPDYLVLCDTRAVLKSFTYVHEDTTVVLARKAAMYIAGQPISKDPKALSVPGHPETPVAPVIARAKRIFYAEFTNDPNADPVESIFYHAGILTGALSLACCLGLRKVYLYGIDMWREFNKAYAYDLSPAPPTMLKDIPGHPGKYSSPAFDCMTKAVESNLNAWRELEIINRSRDSQLKCFPIDKVNALPLPAGAGIRKM